MKHGHGQTQAVSVSGMCQTRTRARHVPDTCQTRFRHRSARVVEADRVLPVLARAGHGNGSGSGKKKLIRLNKTPSPFDALILDLSLLSVILDFSPLSRSRSLFNGGGDHDDNDEII